MLLKSSHTRSGATRTRTPYNAKLKCQNIVDKATFRTGGTSVTYDESVKTEG